MVTEAEYERIESYVRLLQEKLNLQSWMITVSREPALDDAWASMATAHGANEGVLRIAPNFGTKEEPYRRAVLIHEMLHAVFCHPYDDLLGTAERAMGVSWAAVEKIYIDGMERAIDTLAYAIAPLFPSMDDEA